MYSTFKNFISAITMSFQQKNVPDLIYKAKLNKEHFHNTNKFKLPFWAILVQVK